MTPTTTITPPDGFLLSQAPVTAAFIALAGVIFGVVVRDVILGLYQSRKARADALADKQADLARKHRDLVRLYADPLWEAARSLRFRLDEIVERQQGRYLRADEPDIVYFAYKRVSTLYRLAVLLGWIRAMRRERSYLDPEQASAAAEMQAITDLEVALADGDHVELHRLDELMILWRVPLIEGGAKARIATLIDVQRARFLASKDALSARDLPTEDQIALAESCALIVRERATIDVPAALVKATAEQAAIIFGIKEAYIYRDWQAAIGDMMIEEATAGARHFSVIGFGAFEDLYVAAKAKKTRGAAARWFDRLEALFHDLDMEHSDTFDARRQQMQKLHVCCRTLEAALNKRIAARPKTGFLDNCRRRWAIWRH